MALTLAKRLGAGETVITAWSAVPEPVVHQLLANCGFGAVTLDGQHGQHDERSLREGISAIVLAGGSPVVRIPVGSNDLASRLLDYGAEAIIAPMIDTKTEANAFVAASKYPPLGDRSWGPRPAMPLHGFSDNEAWLHAANQATLAFAMIETELGVEILDDILGLDGIDGIFVGPSDLAISLSKGATLTLPNDDVLAEIAKRANASGKIAGIFCNTPEQLVAWQGLGYRFLALTTDLNMLAAGAKQLLAKAKI